MLLIFVSFAVFGKFLWLTLIKGGKRRRRGGLQGGLRAVDCGLCTAWEYDAPCIWIVSLGWADLRFLLEIAEKTDQ